MYLSVVIPAYNEEKRICDSLNKICNYLKEKNYKFEIIVVDDKSDDGTLNLLKEFSEKICEITILQNEQNIGKGFSVKKGILKSKGDIILFTDADLSTPIAEMDKLIHYLEKDFQIAIGSRGLPESQVKRRQMWYRELMGKCFNKIIRFILNLDYRDTQCGFKCFQRNAALEIFRSIKQYGFAFDVEALFIAKRKGFKVKEEPVLWYDSPDSKVKIIRDSAKMLWDVLKIRFSGIMN